MIQKRDWQICLIILVGPWLVMLGLVLVAILLAMLPRVYTRQLRHRLVKIVLWQWMKGSNLSAILHEWLWKNGNGKEHNLTP